jgi:hypothetical protein
MGRSRRCQAPYTQLRFLEMFRQGIYTYFLCSSLIWAHVVCQYSIVFYPRTSPEETKCQPLLEETVLLTLRNAPGVVSQSHAPPGITAAPIEHQRSIPSRFFPVDHGMILT